MQEGVEYAVQLWEGFQRGGRRRLEEDGEREGGRELRMGLGGFGEVRGKERQRGAQGKLVFSTLCRTRYLCSSKPSLYLSGGYEIGRLVSFFFFFWKGALYI